MKRKRYEYLREIYPPVIHLDQFYQICHIAKRTAKYLLDQGIVPCEDSGKLTRRYKILLDDVIAYLYEREKKGSMVPVGIMNSKKTSVSNHTGQFRESFSRIESSTSNLEQEVTDYFEQVVLADKPDVITTTVAARALGLHIATVQKIIKEGELKTLVVNNKALIPKPYLMEFITSYRYLHTASLSPDFKKVLGGFKEWKAAK